MCLTKQHCQPPTCAEPQPPPVLQQGIVSTEGRQKVRWDSERQRAGWQTDGSPSMAEISLRRWLLSSSSSIFVMTLPLSSTSFVTRRWCSAWAATCIQQTFEGGKQARTCFKSTKTGGPFLHQHIKSSGHCKTMKRSTMQSLIGKRATHIWAPCKIPACPSAHLGKVRDTQYLGGSCPGPCLGQHHSAEHAADWSPQPASHS